MTMLTSTIAWCRPCVERARGAHSSTLHDISHFIGSSSESYHSHLHTIHGAPSLTRFSLSTSTFSPCPSPSTSSTPSCTLSSTTRSSWKACATPPTRRVRTPTTSPPLPHCTGSRREIRRGKHALYSCTKRGMASEPDEGTGHPLSWTSLQSVEVGADSGPMSWR